MITLRPAIDLPSTAPSSRLAEAGAIQDLDLALVIEPANALALWRRGEAKRQQGDAMGAMGDLSLGTTWMVGMVGDGFEWWFGYGSKLGTPIKLDG